MIFSDWTQELLVLETKLVSLLQPRSYYIENFLHSVSVVSDPNNAIFYVYPCIAALCTPRSSLPFELMLIGSLLSWSSIHVKWAFRGDRPFWWVKEVIQSYPNLPALRQTHNTCVANPGNPSSHVMVHAGVLLVLVNSMLSTWRNSSAKNSKFTLHPWYSWMWKWGCWGFYTALILIVMLSRIYNSTHFPHQCIFGAIFGGYLATKIHANWNSEWREKQKSWKVCVFTLMPVIIAIGTYWIQKAFDIDPQRSVRLAFKWCFSPYDISVNTTPVYYLTCSCGCLFGLGVVLLLQRQAVAFFFRGLKSSKEPYFHSLFANNSWLFYLTNGVGVLLSACLLFKLQSQIPTDSVTIFYLHHFALNFAAPFLYFAFVPIMLKLMTKKIKIKED
ncbi:glucose-6-phosphatase 2 [Hetaerina americana]|uniref:glucose-6-phosphatase 2 n=1 Tax=Hetaerina americana TaxID=62018 RepID=UPI003A7F3A98